MILPTMIVSAAEVQLKIENVGEVVQLMFSGHKDWEYKIIPKTKSYEIRIPKLSNKSKQVIKDFKSSLISKIELMDGIDGGDLIIVESKFDDFQSFDYQMEDPSKLVIDFFREAESKKSNKEKKVSKIDKKQKRGVASEILKYTPDAKALDKKATEENKADQAKTDNKITEEKDIIEMIGSADGGDPNFSRFNIDDKDIKESAIIASRRNYYIKFPYLIQKNTMLERILSKPPVYEIKETDSLENKEVRLLKQLFEKERYSVVLTTINLFREKYPESKYKQLVDYVEADTYYKLWLKNKSSGVYLQQAVALYELILQKYPNSPLNERTKLLIAFTYWNKGDRLSALKSFIKILNTYPDTNFKYDIKLSIADAHRDLHKFKDALNFYREIINDEKAGYKRIIAQFKMGDVFAKMNEYELAIKSYQKAMEENAKYKDKFPNAYYNIAESQFWLKQYKESLKSYVEYIKRYSKDDHAAYAMTRVGEILEILGADKKKVTGALLETWFRFRGAAGAKIARIRYIRHRIPEMKEKEVKAATEEIKKIVEETEIKGVEDFATILSSDGFYDRGKLDNSLELLENYYKSHSTSSILPLVKDRIVRSISRQIQQKEENEDYVGAIRAYGKHAGSWLRDSDRLDYKYSVGKAFEKSGVSSQAEKIYKSTVNKLYAMKGSEEEKERAVFEKLPEVDQVNLRIAKSLMKQNKLADSLEFINRIDEKKNTLSDEDLIERTIILSNIAEGQGRNLAAIKYVQRLLDSWSGKTELVQEPLVRLSELNASIGNYSKAIESIDKVLNLAKDTSLVPEERVAKILEAKANYLMKIGKNKVAAGTFSELLNRFEDKKELNSVRYKLGKIHFDNGKIKEAQKTWDLLKERKNGETWYNLAKEQLDNVKWQDDYNKYLDRMPAQN